MTQSIKIGERYRSRESLDVLCWWWYDTVAILDDDSDSCEAGLPAGELFTVQEIAESDPDRVLCDLERAGQLKEALIPKGRQITKSTPYNIEIAAGDIVARCDRQTE